MDNLVSACYIGCGCNKSPQVLDWGGNNLICFGFCNAVAIYEPVARRVVSTLSEHSNKVNAVKWIRGRHCDKNDELVSASSDFNVIVWRMKCRKNFLFESVSTLTGHKGSVYAIDGKYCGDTKTVIASAGSDSTVRVWYRIDGDEFSCLQVINIGTNVAFCLDMLFIENIQSCLLTFGTDTPELIFYSISGSFDSVNYLVKVSGHEDWIRSVSMKSLKSGDIFVASSGQDMTVRVLRLSQHNSECNTDLFYLKKEEFILESFKYYLSLETVLFGHEGWIYSVDWLPINETDDSCSLLTASFDRTVVVWKPCPASGVWIEESRMGELGGDNSLGYYGGKFAPDGLSVIAHSYQGSFHLWEKQEDKWDASFTLGGHNESVLDISWEENGIYLLSVSSDKTTRLHASAQINDSLPKNIWCELSRPQIHGHGLSSVACLKNLSFASCSEEKVVRVFVIPDVVFNLLKNFCSSELMELEGMKNTLPLPSAAAITALGLSNKAMYETENIDNSCAVSKCARNDNINEDFLIQHTLWPEIMKLYGHGNDVFTIAASHNGKILATAAKATNSNQAKILLWDTETWKIVDTLEGHQLTVTQMSFSPNDTYLLSVSRDRKWCLFKRNESKKFELHAIPEKNSHSRIIWSCGWSHNELYFVTGSRDCKVIIWESGKPVSILVSDKGSVTAVAFAPIIFDNESYLIAVGHECGDITLYLWNLNGWTSVNSIPKYLGHHLTVQRLLFCPLNKTKLLPCESSTLKLASCSIDHSVRIFDVDVGKLKKLCII